MTRLWSIQPLPESVTPVGISNLIFLSLIASRTPNQWAQWKALASSEARFVGYHRLGPSTSGLYPDAYPVSDRELVCGAPD